MSEISWENDDKTIIPNQLPARLMRNLMMCKGGLEEKGSIYYGTGRTYQVSFLMEDGTTVTYNVPEVAVVEAPSNPQVGKKYQLIYETTSGGGVELKWEVMDEQSEDF